MTEQFEQAVQKVMKEQNITKASAQKIVGNIELKSKKARLLKIRLAGVGLPKSFGQAERRELIQKTHSPTSVVSVNKEQKQNRLKQEVDYINKGTKINPTGSTMDTRLKKRLAKITKGNTTFPTQTPEDIVDIEDINKNIKPLKGTTQTKKKKLPPSSVTNRYAKEHGHTIVFKGVARGVYRSASLEGQQGRYAKYWLLNAKQTNGNGWGIATHTAQQNMKKFIGRPLVVTSSKWHGASMYGESFEHPYLPTNDLNQIFAHQEKFRVGNIVDIQKDSNDDYYATIEMLPKFAGMNLPPFCSPAIYQLDARENEGNISKWEALHLAALDENPAYGARIALLRGTCIGTPDACSIQFKVAKLVGRRKPRNSDEKEEQDKEEEQAVDDDRNFFVGKLKRKLGKIQRNAVIMDFTENIGPITSRVQQKTIMDKFGAKKRRSGKYHRKDTEKANAKILENEQDRIEEQLKTKHGITCPNKLKERLANLKKKQKIATRIETDYQTESRINRIKAPLSKEVPFGKENRSPKKIRDDSLNKATDEGLATFGGTKLRPPKPTPEDRARIIKAKLAIVRRGVPPDKPTADSEFKHTRFDSDTPLINKVPFGDEDRNLGTQARDRKSRGLINEFVEKKGLKNIQPGKVTQKDRVRIIKAKLASLGEQNMTYQESKKVKIHKRKHPEVRKAKQSIEDILRKSGSSVDGSHQPSTFLSQKGDFIGGGDIHDLQVSKILGKKTFGETQTHDFIKKHGIARVQTFPINRAGEKRTSFGINSKMNSTQLKSIKDTEIGGRDIGFSVGAGDNITTGRGFKDLTKALQRHKLV